MSSAVLSQIVYHMQKPIFFTVCTKPLQVKSASGKKDLAISYPCVMLNVLVAKNNTNDQYQDLVDPVNKTYKTSSQMSIEFEVDGPYKVNYAFAYIGPNKAEVVYVNKTLRCILSGSAMSEPAQA